MLVILLMVREVMAVTLFSQPLPQLAVVVAGEVAVPVCTPDALVVLVVALGLT